jgi:glycosyltransferase involved in cell wall biosynthesis
VRGTSLAESDGVPETAALPIGIVLTSFAPGGTERQMIELIRRLDRGRWSVHVACLHATGGWLPRVTEAAHTVTEFPIRSFRRADTVQQMRRFARWTAEHRLAVVHAGDLYSNIFALFPAAAARVPVRIANRREINPDKSAAQIALQRLAYGCAHRVAVNSRAAAARLARELVPGRKVQVIANGIDLDRFERHHYRTHPRRVVVVANLRREKAHDVLIDAAALLRPRVPDLHVDIVGDGPERARLEERARTRGVADAITFWGHQEDVGERLSAADLFVLPSRSEAFPNALLEAMASGLPAVATRVGGMQELVDDGRTGCLVPPDDPAALAEALGHLMAHGELAVRLGANAREQVRQRYSFDRMIGAFEALYLSELSRRGVPGAAVHLQLAAS